MQTKNRPWIALIFFCTTIVFITALVLAIVFAGATAMYAVASTSEVAVPVQTFSGVITDAHCGAKHKLTDKSSAECTRICVKNGSQYVLVGGDHVHALRGDKVQLNRMAGERVTVVGLLRGNTIDFTAISAGQ